jgi:hypothetical protein
MVHLVCMARDPAFRIESSTERHLDFCNDGEQAYWLPRPGTLCVNGRPVAILVQIQAYLCPVWPLPPPSLSASTALKGWNVVDCEGEVKGLANTIDSNMLRKPAGDEFVSTTSSISPLGGIRPPSGT